MRPTHTPFLLTVLGSCLLLPLSSPAPLTAYMKIDDIDGEATDTQHKDWIIIQSIDGGIEHDAASASTGKRQHRPFTVIKPLDKASPLLMDSLTKGTPIENVTFESTEPYPGSDGPTREVTYFRYKMEQVRITRYALSRNLDGDPDRPLIERVSLEFPYAEWHVRQLSPDGTELIDAAGAFFDMELNESGPASFGPVISQVGNVDVTTGETFDVDIGIEDFDTPHLDLEVEVEANAGQVKVGPVKWMAPEMLRLSLTTTAAASGQVPVTLYVSDGENNRSMSFTIFVDSSGTPWDGFLKAYFTEEERDDPNISSPIEDPDGDTLDTLLEFLLGTNPREHTLVDVNREGDGAIKVRFPWILDPDSDGDSIDVEFNRRIDDPRIHLSLHASFDGGDSWTRLANDAGDKPLYKENAKEGENPLYETVSGSVNPPDEATATLIRFVGEME